ncbi:restriction endonuclease subunit S [Vibrio parahaemolyticus]|uniref:restriction endonuclease subunit S n=1 Tax=Vibrio parahaemolyticus TaxID=670 RepID=UPI000A3A249C|nr:restriction endonuclease subunit S [Vibrio parahaemolyticus]ELA9372132.1 restriction endonuclease subunit S [Vibrio parahaemolyticus]ELA9373428.1 restriction endonuclease subunit S [Vibrio parahaemolyticus]OUJ52139.1 hypothetical protein BTM22_06860 [Vibrio parahaemolyticus]TOE60126.1 hypothetical protein CGJ40_09035 [Vibrio parahaemolyticus]HCG8706646.1 restriction endonuclease subunit S [Vibrio parahaemolyticus]
MTEQQLPEGWKMVKFGDIAKHVSKRVEPSETDLEVYVGLEHLDPDSLKIKRHGVPSDVSGQKLLVKKGQIIFGKRRAYQRKVAVADWDCICSAHAMVLEGNPKSVIPEFLPFFMQSDVFMERAVAVSEGSLSPTIKWKVLAAQQFIFPDLIEQKKLLELIGEIESSINSTKSAIEAARTLSSAYSFQVFGGEDKQKIENHIDLLTGFPFSSKMFENSGEIKLLRGINIKQGNLMLEGDELKCWKSSAGLEKYRLAKNDIVISMDGSLVGRNYCLIDKLDGEMLLVQRVARLRCRETLSYRYLYHAIASAFFKHYVDMVKTVTAIPHISPADIRNFSISFPKREKQEEVANVMDLIDSNIATLEEKLIRLGSLKKAVFQKLAVQG